MTDIAFHFGAPDKLVYVCRVARKLLRQDRQLVIEASAEQLDQLDGMLWNMMPQDFVAHCRSNDPAHLVQASAIVLTEDIAQAPHHDTLLHLRDAIPQGFERFARLIEVVSGDEADRACARQRWKRYKQDGYAIETHDLVTRSV